MMMRPRFRIALILSLSIAAFAMDAAVAFGATSLTPAFADQSPRGPRTARGVIVYSHGRSLTGEDSLSPAPAYLRYLSKAGWDVLRFNRPSSEDTLPASAADLARRAEALKVKGYKSIILTGQSFGAFLSIMAAGQTTAVDGIVATSPAAFGSYSDSFDTWRLNATRLYSELAKLHRGRVLLAFFHGDDYDPGGRGERAQAILSRNGVSAIVIDQPPDLVGHLAAATPRFASRYGDCLERFAEGTGDYRACSASVDASLPEVSSNIGDPAGSLSNSTGTTGIGVRSAD
jgi:hypothetical protein